MGKIEEGRIRLTERGRNKFIGLWIINNLLLSYKINVN
jgi:hypothetical protein